MKRNIVILFIVMILGVAGCTTGGDGTTNVGVSGAFNGGDRALTYAFAEGAPPERIRDGGLQPFQVRVRVQNSGEYDISEGSGFVTLTGFNPADLGLTQTSQALPFMRGFKKQGNNVIDGTVHQATFNNLRYEPELPSGSTSQRIFANFCYPYQTNSLARICIAGDTLRSFDGESTICELEGAKEFANSGAPVRIENVEQFPAGTSSIQIQFDIVHTPTSDEGRLFQAGTLDSQCNVNGNSPSSADADLLSDYVRYTVDTNLPLGLNCENTGTGSNQVQLTNNRYTVFCIQDTTGQSEYERPIDITLEYDYLERISTDVTVEHISQ